MAKVRVDNSGSSPGIEIRVPAIARGNDSNSGTVQSIMIGTPAVTSTGIDNSSTTPDIDTHLSTVASIGVHNIDVTPSTNVHASTTTGTAVDNNATVQGANIHTPAIPGSRVNNKDLKIMTLFKKNVLRVGDQWKFSFVFQTANGNVLVEKVGTVSDPALILYKALLLRHSLEVTGTSKSGGQPGFPNLRFPPGQYVFSDPARQDLTLRACTGPYDFCKAVLRAYGPIPSDATIRNKSWRSIRVLRNGQDLGTLADIRESCKYIS